MLILNNSLSCSNLMEGMKERFISARHAITVATAERVFTQFNNMIVCVRKRVDTERHHFEHSL